MSANIRIRFGLQIVFVCLPYLKALNLPVRYIMSSVWVRLSIFSPYIYIYIYIYVYICVCVGLYVFCLPISLVMIDTIYILCLIIIIKSEVWTITHCLGLGHEIMVSAVSLSILLSVQIIACRLFRAKLWPSGLRLYLIVNWAFRKYRLQNSGQSFV